MTTTSESETIVPTVSKSVRSACPICAHSFDIKAKTRGLSPVLDEYCVPCVRRAIEDIDGPAAQAEIRIYLDAKAAEIKAKRFCGSTRGVQGTDPPEVRAAAIAELTAEHKVETGKRPYETAKPRLAASAMTPAETTLATEGHADAVAGLKRKIEWLEIELRSVKSENARLRREALGIPEPVASVPEPKKKHGRKGGLDSDD